MIKKLSALLCLIVALTTLTAALQAGVPKSADHVKANAKATKADDKGVQTVTLTLDIDKGWHLYANPVNHEFLEGAQTRVKVTAKEKVKANVKYPVGKTHVDKKEKYDIYEGKVTIEVGIQRTAGDVSPLEIVIDVQACDSKVCLMPSKIKLQVP